LALTNSLFVIGECAFNAADELVQSFSISVIHRLSTREHWVRGLTPELSRHAQWQGGGVA